MGETEGKRLKSRHRGIVAGPLIRLLDKRETIAIGESLREGLARATIAERE